MYQRSLKLIDKFRQGNRQFAVIGLGRFGQAVCETLYKLGYDVLGTDREKKVVNEVLAANILENAIQLDSTEIGALKEAGIFEFDTVIIAIGSYIQESIITTLNLKEGGVNYVIAKASSEIHGKLLHRVGADKVIFPEYDAGCELARRRACDREASHGDQFSNGGGGRSHHRKQNPARRIPSVDLWGCP